MRQELTAPVSAIVGYAEILREDISDDQPGELVADLKQILTAAHTLSEMVDEFLDPEKSQQLFASGELEEIETSIRHDLRTPISGIKGYAEMILEVATDRRPIRDHVDTVAAEFPRRTDP